MSPTVDAPITTEPEKASFLEDLIDIFAAPGKVFARRLDRGVLLTIVFFTVICILLAFANRGTMQPAIEGEINKAIAKVMADNPSMNADALGPMRTWMTFSFTYGIALILPIYFLVLGLLVWITGKFVGSTASYGASLMVTTWSFVPRILGMLAVTVQGFLIDPANIHGLFSLSISPARFMAPDTSQAMLGLLARFDVFLLWQTVLIGIGIAVAAKLPRAKGMTAAVALWVVCAIPVLIQLARS